MITRNPRPLTRASVEAVTGRAMVKAPVRLIHIGLGAFARAHQCWYTSRSDSAGDWGVAAFTGRTPDAARQLNRQDGLYTLVERDGSGDRFSIISCISEAHDGGELGRFFELFADPRSAAVTLTITETGYLLLPNGAPGSDQSLTRDIELLRSLRGATPLPRHRLTTPLGRLTAGLAVRRSAEAGPLAVVPCDNVPDNGPWLRTGVRAIADEFDPQLAAWVDENVSFVSTSVDRITPRTSPTDRKLIGARTGWIDQAPVITEPFTDWVLHGEFPIGRPVWELAGARFVNDIEPFERRKLWLLNGAHSLLAYAGQLRGHATVAQAFADPFCRAAVESLWDDATRHLPGELLDIPAYRANLAARFGNARIDHGLAQIAEDGATKLRMRIAPILSAESACGRVSAGAVTAVTSWIALLLRGVELPDSKADDIRTALSVNDVVSALLGLISPASVADKRLVAAVTNALPLQQSSNPRPANSRGQ